MNIHWKDWCWSWNSNTLATWYEEATHWKRPWCWERLRAGGEGDNRGWDGWMASLTWWTWVWPSSRSWWWTVKPGVPAVHGVTNSWTQLSDWTDWMDWCMQRGGQICEQWCWVRVEPEEEGKKTQCLLSLIENSRNWKLNYRSRSVDSWEWGRGEWRGKITEGLWVNSGVHVSFQVIVFFF